MGKEKEGSVSAFVKKIETLATELGMPPPSESEQPASGNRLAIDRHGKPDDLRRPDRRGKDGTGGRILAP
jgi:hypothetical protein